MKGSGSTMLIDNLGIKATMLYVDIMENINVNAEHLLENVKTFKKSSSIQHYRKQASSIVQPKEWHTKFEFHFDKLWFFFNTSNMEFGQSLGLQKQKIKFLVGKCHHLSHSSWMSVTR